MNEFMQLAIEAARKGMESNMGGPFGAVIVRNGEVIAVAHNEVIGECRCNLFYCVLLAQSD